jgi:hypothetical protein
VIKSASTDDGCESAASDHCRSGCLTHGPRLSRPRPHRQAALIAGADDDSDDQEFVEAISTRWDEE